MRAQLIKVTALAGLLVLLAAGCTPGEEVEAEPGLPDEDTDVALEEGEAPAEPEAPPPAAVAGELLGEIQSRGSVICGVNDAVPGFGSIDADGNFVGFDIDFCRVVAAAVLGDADAVEYRPLTAGERFTALQSGEIDVLIRNTTWTATRDGNEGAAFATTTYYDGQAMMVRAGEFGSIDEMTNTVVCVLEGTTTELNLATRFAAIPYEPLTFAENDDLQEAFIAEACDGWTSDLSQLSSRRAAFPEEAGGPDSLQIFSDDVFSKEPLGPVVRDGDSQWFDAVNWAVIATIQAEEFGITSANIDEFMDHENDAVRRLLGVPSGEEQTVFDPGLGLPADFAEQIIRQVGNYGEIFDRHIGPDTPLGLDRGFNALWTEGGLLYAPPYV